MFGRRPDGRRIRGLNPLFYVVPHIMPKRSDSQVFTEMDIDISAVEHFVKQHKAEHPGISYMSVVIAAMVKVISEAPQLNRFVIGKRVYARNNLSICYAIINDLAKDEPDETVLQIYFKDGDTIFDIADKVSGATSTAKNDSANVGTDRLLRMFFKLPQFLIGAFIAMLLWFDRRDMLIKPIVDASPFHTTMYVTNMASIGMESVYHHIYDTGTTSIFLAMGKRHYTPVYGRDGLEATLRTMPFKFVIDERITSGYVYSKAFKQFEKYLKNPQLLEEPYTIAQDIR